MNNEAIRSRNAVSVRGPAVDRRLKTDHSTRSASGTAAVATSSDPRATSGRARSREAALRRTAELLADEGRQLLDDVGCGSVSRRGRGTAGRVPSESSVESRRPGLAVLRSPRGARHRPAVATDRPVEPDEDLAQEPREGRGFATGAERLDGGGGDDARGVGGRERSILHPLRGAEDPASWDHVGVAGTAGHRVEGNVAAGPRPCGRTPPGGRAPRSWFVPVAPSARRTSSNLYFADDPPSAVATIDSGPGSVTSTTRPSRSSPAPPARGRQRVPPPASLHDGRIEVSASPSSGSNATASRPSTHAVAW